MLLLIVRKLFSGKTHDYEHLTLNGNNIEWVPEIKRLGNNLNISCDDELDCQIKTSHFIGCVNKRGDLDLYISIKFVQHGM